MYFSPHRTRWNCIIRFCTRAEALPGGHAQDSLLVGNPTMRKCDVELVNTQALERTNRNDHFTNEFLWRPVRPATPTGQIARAHRVLRRPKTTSSGGTLSELADLGLSWSRQATQDTLNRRRDKQRIAQGWKS